MRAFDIAAATPWAIQEEVLRSILEVAAREGAGPEAVAAKLGRPLDNTRSVELRGDVAVIPVRGVISRYMNLFSEISGGTSVQVLARDFNEALENPNVRAILLDIDSPGGEVVGVGEFSEMVFQARGKKPLCAYVSGVGASAAYWLASAADEVVAAPTAVLGSIGVVMAHRDRSAADERAGVKTVEFVSSQSPNKRPDLGTETGKSQVQQLVDDLAAVFIADVARNRGVTAGTVLHDYGAGGTRVGKAAVDAGLADRLGSLEALIDELGGRTPSYGQGTSLAAGHAQTGEKGTNPMSLWEQIQAALGGGQSATPPEEQPAARPASATPPAAPAAATDEVSALRAQLADRDRLLAEERERHVTTAAVAFATQQVTANRALPAERASIEAAFAQAMRDDLAQPLAQGSRVAALGALYSTRSPHALTDEQLPVALEGATVLENRLTTPAAGAEKPMSQAEKDALLGMTSLGKSIIASRNGGGS